ncbi:MAG TPA: aldehyde dehydrogenase [Novosphingobium sp.]|nr:aldehyde dehydrogenase [Novosphingobium sp.]
MKELTVSSTENRMIELRHPDKFFIDGKWVAPSSGATSSVIDSATEIECLRVAEAQLEDMERAVAAARRAFDHGPWPRMSPAERGEYLSRIADAWERRADQVGDAWTLESGVLRSMSAYSGPGAAAVYRFHAGLGESFSWTERRTSATGGPALLVQEPVGVVAAIIPWNSPTSLLQHKAAPALIAGCTLVVKSSPEAPAAPYIFAEICEEIGLPPGVVNVINAEREVSEALVRNPGIDKVSFTGSTAAGRKIASICGERIARVTLELGGKSPALILDDYDVGKAAAQIAAFAPMVTGQVCASLTRIIVGAKRHDEFVDALSAEFSRIKVGDPFDPATQMGPLATARHRDRVESYIEQGQAEGSRMVHGGKRPAHLNRGYFVEPTIFANVDNSSTIAQEEIFGPVVSVIPAGSEEEAIAIANDTIFGLNSAVFTEDADRCYAVGRQIRAGTVGHNGFKLDLTIGFGGFKQSGIGREGGLAGIGAYLEPKTMLFETEPKLIG